MAVKVHRLRKNLSHNIILLHEVEPGMFACPVCGDVSDIMPWYPFGESAPDGTEYAMGSLDLCACGTQWGNDDSVQDDDPMAMIHQWSVLRDEWLAHEAPDPALVERQLANIGIDLEAYHAAEGEEIRSQLERGDLLTAPAGRTPLIRAVNIWRPDLVEHALRAGVAIDACTGNKWTALMFAAGRGFCEIVKQLIDAGASLNRLNRYHETALLLAAKHAPIACVRLLLEAGADPTIRTHPGISLLRHAEYRRDRELVKLVEEALGGRA